MRVTEWIKEHPKETRKGIFVFLLVALAVTPASAATCYNVYNQSFVCIDANIIDYTNLSTMIANVALIIPGIVTLVVSTVPLFIVHGVVYLITGIFAGVIAMFAKW